MEWQNIYPLVNHWIFREAGSMTMGHYQISQSNWLDGRGLAKNYLNLQIRDWQRTTRSIDRIWRWWQWKMARKDDEEGWCLKDQWSLESSSLNGVFGWNDSHRTLIEISLPIILHLHFMWPEFFFISICWEKLIAHLLGIRTFVHLTST